MNGLIDTLAVKANLIVSEYNGFDRAAINQAEKRFAELIVQECVKSVQETPAGYQDYRSQIEEAMRDYCASSIKEHFGVEE